MLIVYGNQRLPGSKTWLARILLQIPARILGTDALDLDELARKRQRQGIALGGMHLDFFFDSDSPLNPESDPEEIKDAGSLAIPVQRD